MGKRYDVIIVGGSPAGIFLSRDMPQLLLPHPVVNTEAKPGYPDSRHYGGELGDGRRSNMKSIPPVYEVSSAIMFASKGSYDEGT